MTHSHDKFSAHLQRGLKMLALNDIQKMNEVNEKLCNDLVRFRFRSFDLGLALGLGLG